MVVAPRQPKAPAELTVFLLVDLLEDWALVPADAFVTTKIAVQLLLRYVHHPNLEHLVNLGIGDQVIEAAPGAFEFLELVMVQDLVDLLGELLVDLGDDRLTVWYAPEMVALELRLVRPRFVPRPRPPRVPDQSLV
jgi:hypothetical protein